jgi:hypothetical protein
LPQFAFDNFGARLLSFLARQRVVTSCSQAWERVLIDQTRVSEAAESCNEADMVSLLSLAVTGLPLG